MAKGNGIESKGKTKGKQIGTNGMVSPIKSTGGKGGVTNADLKAVGRNLAKMKAQG